MVPRVPSHRQAVSFVGAAGIDNMHKMPGRTNNIEIHGTGTFSE